MKVQKIVAIPVGTLMLVTNVTPILAEETYSMDTNAVTEICRDNIEYSSNLINEIIDGIEIEKEEPLDTTVYNEVSYAQPVSYIYVEKEIPVTQSMTVDEFMALYGSMVEEESQEETEAVDISIEQAAYDQALANYNAALAEYEAASLMIENTKEVEVEIVEEVTDEEGNVTPVTKTEIQTVTEMIPAGDVETAKANLNAASAALESARINLETAKAQASATNNIEQVAIDETAVVKETITYTDSGSCGENLTWSLDDEGALTVSGTGAMTDFGYGQSGPWGSSVKTATIEEGVTSIGSGAFYGCSNLTNIVIPDSVLKIGDYAFMNCQSLTEVVLPNGITDIANSTFSGCSVLTSVVIPDSVVRINMAAFSDCKALTAIIIPENVTRIGQSAFNNCDNLSKITIKGKNTQLSFYTFYGCTSLKTAGPIGSGCDYEFAWNERLESYAFQNLTGLTSVIIPDGITSIGNSTFENCSGLTAVTLPDTVTLIDNNAFLNCTGLTSINIPDGVTSIGNKAFSGCTSLTDIIIPDSVTNVGDDAFNGTPFIENYPSDLIIFGNTLYQYKGSDTEVTIPDHITSIKPNAFFGCTDLTRVVIPDSVTEIGYGAFQGCTGLTSLTIPESVTYISNNAFKECTQLKTAGPIGSGSDIEFGWSDSIPRYAFSGCADLTNITLPNSVKTIGADAFSGCSTLTEIELPDALTTIETGVFSGCTSLNHVVIPDGITNLGWSLFSDCTSLTDITIPNTVTTIGSYAFQSCTALTSITIPDSVTTIESYAFSGCTNLTDVVIPDSVSKIGSGAFDLTPFLENQTDDFVILGSVLYQYKGNDTEVIIPEGVKSIGERVFQNRADLTNVTLPDSIVSIEFGAFQNCTSLTSITIPEGVTVIEHFTFAGCTSLTDVIIPKSVVSIRSYAFEDTPFIENNTDDLIILGSVLYRYRGDAAELTIDPGIVSINDEAFAGCTGLKSITIPDTVRTINDYAFRDCTSLESLYIPEGVTRLGYFALYNCTALTSLTLPTSVRPDDTVLNPTPAGCTSLKDVYYLGTEEQWNANKMFVGAFGLDPDQITMHFKPAIPFTDVPEDAWYYSVAKECYETVLINGTSESTFSPMQTMTRAMVVTILWRLEGQPSTAFNNKFKDVSSRQWYATSISWAVNNGVVNGYGDGTFKPDAAVTREQVAVMLANYATYKGVYVPGTKKLNTYPDGSQVSKWAQSGMKWALSNGIISGNGEGYLRPKKSATRAEGAAMLLRMKNWL